MSAPTTAAPLAAPVAPAPAPAPTFIHVQVDGMGLSGHGVTAADSLALTGTYKGWINLCTTTSDDQCPHEALQKAGIVFKRVPVEVCVL
jgi:hypothetical protein